MWPKEIITLRVSLLQTSTGFGDHNKELKNNYLKILFV